VISLKVARKDARPAVRRATSPAPPATRSSCPTEMPLFMRSRADRSPRLPAPGGGSPLRPRARRHRNRRPRRGPPGHGRLRRRQEEEDLQPAADDARPGEGRRGPQSSSRHATSYPLTGPSDQPGAAKQSNARPAPRRASRGRQSTRSRPPPRSRATGKTSIERAGFEVPPEGGGPAAQQPLPLLRRADPLPADARRRTTLPGTRPPASSPHLAGPVSQAATPNLSVLRPPSTRRPGSRR